MGKYNLGAEALVDQAESFKTFLGLNQPEPGDRFFLVIGLTGAGKSTFVSNCTGHDVTIGHGLYSCTNSIGAFQYTRHGQRIFLIDTPGFNDTSRSDIETLEVLATYLGASYANGVRIHGIITLYPITNNRMAGSNLRSLRILKEICGFSSYSNLAIVTTMWPESQNSKNRRILKDRELELMTNPDFFSDLVSQGARMFRDYDENHSPANSEQRIIDTLLRQLDHGKHAVLQLQREVVDEGKNLGETTAGIAASEHLNQTCRKHENQRRMLDAEMERTSSGSEQEYSLQLQELKAEVDREIEKTKRGRQVLVKTMRDLHETETKALKQRISNLQSQYETEVQNKEMILRDVQESCAALQKEIARLANSSRQQQIVARQTKSHQKALSKAQKDAEKIRRDRQKVQGYTKEIVGGVMNGIAAGAVASVMGGLMCIVM
ncbi:GTP binding domain-containing protein [Fusarium mexicanum]|uniref:GTP binding domain-containing protein n=1 Tax=Fusarium mexicanum TaxID=751941 RepID=A0A8H5J867_9HYPO|nr:GTP binding domain-containing protein [Fusarium mexicanum]